MIRRHLKETWPFLIIIFTATMLSLRSIYLVCENYIVPLFWDQWDFLIDLARDSSGTISIGYLFKAHNEHVIATAKILVILDYFFFNLTNGPLVIVIVMCAVLTSLLIAFLLFHRTRKGAEFWAVSSVLIASSLSMVQWQNLLWGFQTEFYLVLIGAVFSLICALRLSESTKWQGQARWFGALVSATAFSVFSMASGFALPISIVIFFILVRYSRRGLLLFSLIGVLLIAVDLMLTRDPPVVGDAALRTPLNMAVYFFSMMGGPFSSNLNSSVTAGAVAFFILVAAFTRYAAVPWLKGKPVDKVSAALFALCSFLCASAAAASYGRTPMGVESALSSRYSTPMLLLIMTISLVLIRQAMLKCQKYELQPTKFTLLLFLMVTCVGLTTFRNNAAAYSGFVKWSTRAAYFVASGVDHESQLKSLFPNAAAIRPALEMLRNQKLNIFATWGGLPMPSANQVLEGANIPSDQVCSRSAVDSITQLSLHQWQASGWAADEEGRSPAWILAFDQNGRLLGFTKPLEDRPDVTKAIGAEEGFQGFLIPVSGSDSMKKPVALVVIYGDEKPPCRIRAPSFPE